MNQSGEEFSRPFCRGAASRAFPATAFSTRHHHAANYNQSRNQALKPMQTTKRPVSKVRMALTWLIFVGITVAWIAFLIWRRQNNSPAPAETAPAFVTG